MILVAHEQSSLELLDTINKIGVKAEKHVLPYGDYAFEGNGPSGRMFIGIERKKLHDMLSCVDDSRYSAHQKIGMAQYYKRSYLMVEGVWKPHDQTGHLMEGFNAGKSFGYCKQRSQPVMYHKLYRYLLSVGNSGVQIDYTRDPYHTAFNICECYHYYQKKWDSHTSMLETQKLNIPSLSGKPSLARRWAAEVEGLGVKLSMAAASVFRTGYDLAHADEFDWMEVDGVTSRMARASVREIRGQK